MNQTTHSEVRFKVAVLLATYNGQAFVAELIESIRTQGFKDWVLYIRDDGSGDDTVNILKSFVVKDRRIHLIEDKQTNLGAIENFNCLMEYVADMGFLYYCFSDQDDVWKSNKLELQLKALRRLEGECGVTPVLVHTDLKVVAEDLSTIYPSFIQHQGVRVPKKDAYRLLAVQNYVTGCTVMFNHALLSVACPIPPSAGMHDWWLAFCAASTGKIDYLPERTVLYRQHRDNVMGVAGGNLLRNGVVQRWRQGQVEMINTLSMSSELLSRVDTQRLNVFSPKLFLEKLSKLPTQPFYHRPKTIFHLGIYRSPWFMSFVLYARLLFL